LPTIINSMKRLLKTLAICAVCALTGYGAGTIIKNMNSKINDKDTFEKTEVEIKNGVLTPEILLSLGRVSDPQISPDASLILYGVSYNSLKQNRSCRNLYVCNTEGGKSTRISHFNKSVSCARWSEDGKHIYFLLDGQLYKAAFKGDRLGRKIRLSDIPAGISEFKIAPGEKQILYISSVKNPLLNQPSDLYDDLDKARAYETEDLMYRHWDHWVTDIPRSYVAPFGQGLISPDVSTDLLGKGEENFELPTEPFGGIEQLDWAPDGRHIAYSCRKKSGIEYAFSTASKIYIYDIVSGKTIAVTEKGGYDTNPVWSPDGTALAFISMERDGYEADRQRLMVAEIDGAAKDLSSDEVTVKTIRELTGNFTYDVDGMLWTSCSQKLLFSSIIDGIGTICRVKAREDKPEIQRLTPVDFDLSFGTPFYMKRESDGIMMLCTRQSMIYPIELANVRYKDNGNVIFNALTQENDRIIGKLEEIRVESMILKTAQGENLQCWVLYPPKFEEKDKWPVVEMFPGGPQGCLDQSWSYRWNFRMMCQQGYVVVLPNRHGNSGFGQAWKEQISGDYQGLNMEDYKIAARWAKSQKWCSGVAGVGASYGGFSVYNMMGIHEDLFDCFISHAGIFSERQMWYTTEESWFANWDGGGLTTYAYEKGQTGPKGDGISFGGMQQAGAPYANVAKSKYHYAHEPESRVTKWHTPILCMHGMKDYRIPCEQGMAAFNAAKMMGVPAKLVIFPDECHWILQPQNALLWHREFFGWLEKWMKTE